MVVKRGGMYLVWVKSAFWFANYVVFFLFFFIYIYCFLGDFFVNLTNAAEKIGKNKNHLQIFFWSFGIEKNAYAVAAALWVRTVFLVVSHIDFYVIYL